MTKTCDKCGSEFENQGGLNLHKQTHKKTKSDYMMEIARELGLDDSDISRVPGRDGRSDVVNLKRTGAKKIAKALNI